MTSTDPQFHRIYDEEFFDALHLARGAFMGTRIATGNLDEALDAAIEQAFNAGVAVGIGHADPA